MADTPGRVGGCGPIGPGSTIGESKLGIQRDVAGVAIGEVHAGSLKGAGDERLIWESPILPPNETHRLSIDESFHVDRGGGVGPIVMLGDDAGTPLGAAKGPVIGLGDHHIVVSDVAGPGRGEVALLIGRGAG